MNLSQLENFSGFSLQHDEVTVETKTFGVSFLFFNSSYEVRSFLALIEKGVTKPSGSNRDATFLRTFLFVS